METIFELFKYLAARLSLTELLVVIGTIVGATFFLVRFILENRDKFPGLLGGKEKDNHKELLAKLDRLATSEEVGKLLSSLRVAYSEHDSDLEHLLEKFEELAALRTQVSMICDRILDEVTELKHLLQSHNEGSQAQYTNLLTQLSKSQDAISRNLNQIEKIDEFVKASIPEFRGYHRDLGAELNNLSRDIALVERSLQMQINTANAVKLR
jgi:uncharacterized phage infection (PIP) family protein YhgE